MSFILAIVQGCFLISLIYWWVMIKKEAVQYTTKQKKALVLVSVFGFISLFPLFIAFGQGFINGLTANL